jgi:hypothetical protein
MRQQPGPIKLYCLIKNKFLRNQFCYYYSIFRLPIKISGHTEGKGEAGHQGGSWGVQL